MRTLVVACVLQILMGCSNNDESTTSAKDTIRVVQDSRANALLPSLTYEERQGRHLYMKYCAVCHGTEGKGDGFNAFNLDPKPRDFTDSRYMNALTDARLSETMSQGGRGVNKSVLMPSWGGRLTTIERTYVMAFIRLFGKPKN
jgi:mono/diheme cytochrome c family protein